MAPAPTELENMYYIPWSGIDPFYTATVEAIEEAVLNAMIVNTEMVGRDGNRAPQLPHQALTGI